MNPYEILSLEENADMNEIRRSYRKLSLMHHPDRGGDVSTYISISKAYSILTDPLVRENWEKYGNPDGPQATTFGIALPSWMVDKKYSSLILLIYFICVIVAVPSAVAWWWFNSKMYSNEKVLTGTLHIFNYFIRKGPNMSWKKIVTIISGSLEFNPAYKSELKIKPDDNDELPRLASILELTSENKKDPPFNQPYSIKARTLFHAYLNRVPILSLITLQDQVYVIKTFFMLVGEFTEMLIMLMVYSRIDKQFPTVKYETVELSMRLCSYIVQALNFGDSPFLMLPHFNYEKLSMIQKKRKSLVTLRDFVTMKEKDRNFILKDFSDEEVTDIYRSFESIPDIKVSVKAIVLDDDDPNHITCGSLISAIVIIERTSLSELITENSSSENVLDDYIPILSNEKYTRKPKNSKKRRGKNFKCSKESSNLKSSGEQEQEMVQDSNDVVLDQNYLEQIKSRKTPGECDPIIYCHSPLCPIVKKECWWVIILENNNLSMLAGPKYVSLKHGKKYELLQFNAPSVPDLYVYTCRIISDCYVDFIFDVKFQVNVKPPKETNIDLHYEDESSEEVTEADAITESEDEDQND